MNPEMQAFLQQLERAVQFIGKGEAQLRNFDRALQEIAAGGGNLKDLDQAAKQFNTTIGQVPDLAKSVKKEIRDITTELVAAGKEMLNVSNLAAGMTLKLKQNRKGEVLPFQTRGTVVPGSAGVFNDPQKMSQAVHAALRQIENDYGAIANSAKEATVSIDAMTGRIQVQAEVTRDLGNGMKQSFYATATADPFTDQTSGYTEAQNSFIQQAGGIDRANQMLAQYGLSIRQVTGFYKELNSNVSRFSVVGTDGISTSMGAMDQFGNATLHAARNAQTLLQNVERNITKVLEWSIATGLVYAVMNSLMQAARELDDIEETMTDISIATGAAGDELQRYYETALATANLTGVDVTETLEAQAKAFRAASESADRFRTANVLLRDSLILSRLSGMQQAESLDTLVAALRQSGMGLEDGTKLLDKWVRTSKNAGVSIQDLAQSFAITSDVASTVGVSVDELNGLISTLAEKTILSSTEIGNALRTMFSNITSDEAVKALGEVGIAVTDVNGNMRDWLEINQNIVDLMNSGALSDEQLNRLANALGGGSRRGPQLLALWSNFGRVGQISADSMNANGDAADAMAAKLETLQAAVNEMHNAFNELVQALGYEGGFLELAVDAIHVTTDLVKSIKSVAETFENGASSITAMMIAFVALKRVLGTVNWQTVGGAQGSNVIGFPQQQAGPLAGAANFLGRNPQGLTQTATQGIVSAAPIIIGEIVRGISSGDNVGQVGARIGASIAGAVVGNLILPGAGGLVGAVIADAFVNGIQTKEEAIRALMLGQPTTAAGQLELLQKSFSGGLLDPLKQVGRDTRGSMTDEELLQLLVKGLQSGLEPQGTLLGNPRNVYAQAQEKGFTDEESKILMQMLAIMQPENAKLLLEQWEKYTVLKENEKKEIERVNATLTPTTAKQIGALVSGAQGQALAANFQRQRNALISQAAITGDTDQLTKTASTMDQITVATAALAVSLGKANISQEEYIRLGNTMLNATDAERERIINLASAINDLNNKIEERQRIEGRGGVDQGTSELIAERDALRAEQEASLQMTDRAIAIRDARDRYQSFTEGPTDAQGNRFTSKELNYEQLYERARQMQADYAEFLGIKPEVLEASVTDPIIVAFADGYKEVEGLTGDFANWFIDQMKEIAEEGSDALSFTFKEMRDTSPAEFEQIQKRAKYYEKFLQESYGQYGYNEQSQNIGVLLEGNQARTLNTTMTALNLAIEELTEVEKKQLEGQWNLPSGATAYVPITSLFYQQQNAMQNLSADQFETAANTQNRAAELFATSVNNFNNAVANRPDLAGKAALKDESNAAPSFQANVNVEPQDVIVTVDGKAIANAVAKYSGSSFTTTMRSRGSQAPVAV